MAMRLVILFLISLCLPVEAQLAPSKAAFTAALLKPSASGPSPIAWWKFNDGSGTSAADSSGNSNTGTLNGDATWGTGPNSNGDLVLDGTGDYVEIANEGNFDFERTAPFSVSCWIKANSSATGQRDIASKMQQSGNFHGWVLRYDADNQNLKFILLQSDGAQFIQAATAVNSIVLNTWYFVAATYDGSSANTGLKIYRNGDGDITDARAGGPLTGTILNDAPFWVGRADANMWFGEIDDMRPFFTTLTSGQISALNSGGAQ